MPLEPVSSQLCVHVHTCAGTGYRVWAQVWRVWLRPSPHAPLPLLRSPFGNALRARWVLAIDMLVWVGQVGGLRANMEGVS